MAETAVTKPLGIQDLIKNSQKVSENSAQEALTARYLRFAHQAKSSDAQDFSSNSSNMAPQQVLSLSLPVRSAVAADASDTIDNFSNHTTEQNIAGQLRQKVLQAKKESMLAKAGMSVAGEASQKATGKFLATAWLNVIDSFGLTLIYINIHVFLRWVFGDRLFCKLGEEWLPPQAGAVVGAAGKKASQTIGIVEAMVLIVVDLIIGALIFGVMAFIIMIITWMSEFDEAGVLKKGWMIVKAIWDLGFKNLQALIDLF